MITKDKLKINTGFVLLFAVVLTSILLAIALGVTNISLKEINFGTSGEESNEAFYAADTGVECALYYDLFSTIIFDPNDPNFGQEQENIFGEPNSTVNTKCAGVQVDLNQGLVLDDDPSGPWQFEILSLGAFGDACTVVRVEKIPPPPDLTEQTIIIAKGYNSGGNTECFDPPVFDNRRVERELEVTY